MVLVAEAPQQNRFSAIKRGVIAPRWVNTKLKAAHIAIGESMYIIKCTEKTNSNAFKRIVVLHSYSPVPNQEIYPQTLFGQSAGCPVLSDGTMRKIDALLKTKKKPELLWIYV
jgi:hypothetical protein